MAKKWQPSEIKALREAYSTPNIKMTQSKFGQMLGVELVTVWRWEAGERSPDIDSTSRLDDAAEALAKKEEVT